MVKNLLAVQKTWVWSLGQENPLEKGMTTHSGIAWEIPWTEEYCGLQATGLPRVGQDWVANTSPFSATFTTDALWDLWKWKLCYVSPQCPSTQHSSHLEESLSLPWVLGGMNYKLTANFSPVEDLLERCWKAIIRTVKWWTAKARKEGPAARLQECGNCFNDKYAYILVASSLWI